MDSQHIPNSPITPTPAPQPQKTPNQDTSEALPSVPQITITAEDRADLNATRFIRKLAIFLVVTGVVLVIVVWSFVSSIKTATQAEAAKKRTTKSATSTSSTASSSQNPLNNNGSVSSDVQYCSNVIHANLNC